MEIYPKKYDFLWRVYNRTFFVTSFWLNKNYTKRDFLIMCKGSEWTNNVSKKERKKLSNYGFNFLNKEFPKYKKHVAKISKEANLFFVKIQSRKLSSMSNSELKKDFLNTIKFCIKLWEYYWYTEYFLYDKIEKKIKIDPIKYKGLAKKIREMQKIKFELKKLVNKTEFSGDDYLFKNYFKEIGGRLNRNDLYDLHYNEILDILDGKDIKKVSRKNFVIGKVTGWKPITGNGALKIIDRFDKQLMENDDLKGQIANKGYCRGKVRIINFDLNADVEFEAAKLKKGEVLVTGSTIPQMMVACHNAGAIVTEEGGITSHAAILSRELNKPCVVGTKIATKVLKTGDFVEVDADKGIVRKLK